MDLPPTAMPSIHFDAGARPPHVLFVAVDDLRPELRSYGKTKVITPNLDRLVARALQFDNAHCNFPQCMASRASLLTGIRPKSGFQQWSKDFLPEGAPSMIRHFRDHGWRTVRLGKIYHHGKDDRESWSDPTLAGLREKNEQGNYYDYQLAENQVRAANLHWKWQDRDVATLPPIAEIADAPDEAYSDGQIAARAVEEIRAAQPEGPPLFLAVGFLRPHLPFCAPKKYWDLYQREEVDLADNPFLPRGAVGTTDQCDLMQYGERVIRDTYADLGHYAESEFPVLPEAKQRELVHGYWASVSFMDAQLGKILDALEETVQIDNTIVVLWGDNGFHLGEHALWSKTSPFAESTRVPLLIADFRPGSMLAAGQRTRALVELLDLYPTLCDLAGLPAPPHIEGASLLPILRAPSAPGRDAIWFPTYSRSDDVVVETLLTPDRRLTFYPEADGKGDARHLRKANGQYELFDLKADPRENVNVAGEAAYAAALQALKEKLRALSPIQP